MSQVASHKILKYTRKTVLQGLDEKKIIVDAS